MWVLGLAIYSGFKWLTWWRARALTGRAGIARSLGYLLLWPGMDARSFLADRVRPPTPGTIRWARAMGKTALGAGLLWGLAWRLPGGYPLLAGWIGLFGLVLLLHFGVFHLAVLAWQAAGVEARPIMRAPVLATSLSDFWSNRWNLAFRQLAHDLVLRPWHRRLGMAGAGLAAFVASGLAHELVISLPAGAGYGLPTVYFVVQGVGVLMERSRLGRRVGLARGVRGWFFTAALTAAPAYWLFHPPFITRVILPFMRAVGAL
jgi:alginate O-acetyltransferase complex protein AlgI